MKACIVCPDFNLNLIRKQPWRYVYELQSRLPKLGIDVVIITSDKDAQYTLANISIRQVKKIIPIIGDKLLQILHEENPDVILWTGGILSFYYISRIKNISHIVILLGSLYSVHDIIKVGIKNIVYLISSNMWIYVIGAFIPKILIKVLFNAPFVKGIVVLSRRNKTILENIGVNKRKIFYIPPGIPPCNLKITTETLRKMRSNLNIPPESFVASYIGPVERIRGVDLLIRAFKMAYEKLPSLRLLILARRLFDSPLVVKEESKIMDLITKLGLNDVVKVIKRTLPSEEVKKFIALSDVIVLPFRLVQSEVPLSIMEALSQGKPVISTDVNGVPELISKGFGLVVKRNDPSALANALINIYFDKKIGKVSVKAKFLTWDDVALNMAKIINKVG